MSRAAPSLSILVSLPGLSNQHLFATFALNRPISGSCGPDQCRMSMPTVPKRRLRNEETMLRAYGARTRHAASGRPEIRTDPIALWRRRVATLCRRGDRSHPHESELEQQTLLLEAAGYRVLGALDGEAAVKPIPPTITPPGYSFRHMQRERPQTLGAGQHNIRFPSGVFSVSEQPARMAVSDTLPRISFAVVTQSGASRRLLGPTFVLLGASIRHGKHCNTGSSSLLFWSRW